MDKPEPLASLRDTRGIPERMNAWWPLFSATLIEYMENYYPILIEKYRPVNRSAPSWPGFCWRPTKTAIRPGRSMEPSAATAGRDAR
jgi:hypothetical protein